MKAKSPHVIKKLGEKVKNYSKNIWREYAQDIMLKGLQLKFEQNEHAKQFLQKTGDTTLVEAAQHDDWWGIGYNMHDTKLMENRDRWGKNILGTVLMTVRQRLKS